MPEENKKQKKYNKILIVLIVFVIAVIIIIVSLIGAGKIKMAFSSEDDLIKDEIKDRISAYDEIENKNDSEYITDILQEHKELFDLVEEHQSYRREFRVISISNDEYSVEKYTVVKHEKRFNAESDSKTIISDGQKLYISYTEGYIITSAEEDSIYKEIGITSLESIKKLMESSDYESELENNGKTILLKFPQDAAGFMEEYRISVETGIVIEEYSYLNGNIYRSVVTDYFDVLSDLNANDAMFSIPTAEQ